MLKHYSVVIKIGVDTADNEPSKVWSIFVSILVLFDPYQLHILHYGDQSWSDSVLT